MIVDALGINRMNTAEAARDWAAAMANGEPTYDIVRAGRLADALTYDKYGIWPPYERGGRDARAAMRYHTRMVATLLAMEATLLRTLLEKLAEDGTNAP